MSDHYCPECHQNTRHEPWCSRGDPGERPQGALIWERMEELDQKLDRLARAMGLPEDWADE